MQSLLFVTSKSKALNRFRKQNQNNTTTLSNPQNADPKLKYFELTNIHHS